jgi:very-short-patch-repair endonuclease
MIIRPSKRPSELTKAHVKELRANATEPEKKLWSVLRGRKAAGLKFRRQHPIEPFIADFYCHLAKLVIELDGRSHNNRSDHDKERSRFLGELGLMTLRISNDDVLNNLDGVMEFITEAALPRTATIQSKFKTPPLAPPQSTGEGDFLSPSLL